MPEEESDAVCVTPSRGSARRRNKVQRVDSEPASVSAAPARHPSFSEWDLWNSYAAKLTEAALDITRACRADSVLTKPLSDRRTVTVATGSPMRADYTHTLLSGDWIFVPINTKVSAVIVLRYRHCALPNPMSILCLQSHWTLVVVNPTISGTLHYNSLSSLTGPADKFGTDACKAVILYAR
jgi:hypothetical protein